MWVRVQQHLSLFFSFFFRFASFFVFILDCVHNWIHLSEFGMRLCNKYSTVSNFNKPRYPGVVSYASGLHVINSLHAEYVLRFLLSSARSDFKSKLTFSKILTGSPSECQMVCIQIRTDVLLVLNWVQTICKGYQLSRKEWGT